MNSILQFFSTFFRMQFNLIGEFFSQDVWRASEFMSWKYCSIIKSWTSALWVWASVVHSISFKTNNSVYQLSTSPTVFVTEPKPISKSRQPTWRSKKCTLKPAKYLEILQKHRLTEYSVCDWKAVVNDTWSYRIPVAHVLVSYGVLLIQMFDVTQFAEFVQWFYSCLCYYS